MVAPLLIAALGLAKQKKDQTEANVKNNINAWMDYERARQQHDYDAQAAIMARRASRAGDSGYMQAAMGYAQGNPTFRAPAFVGDNGAGIKFAQALASQKEADAYEKSFTQDAEANQLAWGSPEDESLAGLWGK